MTLMTAIQFKTCSGCQNVKPLTEYHNSARGLHKRNQRCKACVSAYHKIRSAKPEVVSQKKINWYPRTYGITIEDFRKMVDEQGGRCAICGTDEPGGRHKQWQIDHDHACCDGNKSCGKCVRGVLCFLCNAAIGYMKDDPVALESAARYLRERSSTQLQTGVNCG